MKNLHSFALGGCGARANYLFRNHPDWLGDDIRLAAVFDTDRQAAENFRLAHAPGCRICGDFGEITGDPAIGWVMIMTPNATHADLVERCFAAGKDVFCEKPVAVSLDQCRKIRHTRQLCQRQYMTGFTLRYSPFYRKIREIISSGRLGRPVSLEFNETVPPEHGGHIICGWRGRRCHTGFHLLEKCSHDIDIVRFICGGRPARVASFGGLNVFTPENAGLMNEFQTPEGIPTFCRWPAARHKNPFLIFKDIVDHQVCIFEYHGNWRAAFHTNICSALPERRFSFCGTRGALRGDALTGHLIWRTFDGPTETFSFGARGSHAGGDRRLLAELHGRIVGSVAGDGPEADDGIEAALACFAADRAMRNGEVVELATLRRELEMPAAIEPEAIHG